MFDLFLGLVGFAWVSSFTPGPNNMMLMASGANFGFTRTLPHMSGVLFGFTAMVGVVGLGLMQVFDAVPLSYTLLKAVSVVYLLWLAWKVAHAASPKEARHSGQPITFLQALLFQWVNPKAWAMALTAISVYAPDRTATAVWAVAVIFGLVTMPAIVGWSLFGQQLQRFLTTPRRLTAFNWTMAALLVASLLPVLAV
ncbi:MAG: LysE family translocator [Rhodobacteraceae bacterium]|nr:LysE family translocator [Paracoccaceae bacterium]